MTHDRIAMKSGPQRNRGFFAVGIMGGKTPQNLGTLWRSATLFGAAFVFTVGKRYPKQPSDTPNTPLHTPLFHYSDLDDLIEHLPHGCPLVGVEMDERAAYLSRFQHPQRAAYLLGAEDNGLSPSTIMRCHRLVQIESVQPWSMNVAVAGSLVLHDRFVKSAARLEAAS